MKKNITIAVEIEAYRAARMWAAQRGTSISRVVQEIISNLPNLPRAKSAFPLPAGAPEYIAMPPRPPAPTVSGEGK